MAPATLSTDDTSARWDLVVVGAGPAGCAAAAAALQTRPSARVLILDRSDFPRDKVCGDGIAGGAMRLLGSLSLPVEEITQGYDSMHGLRLESPGGVVVDRQMADAVWVIPRLVFDERLLRAVIDKGAQFRRHTVRTIEVEGDEVLLDGVVRAATVIGADGAESRVRRALGHAGNPDRALAVAIRGYGPELPGQDGAQWITMSRENWPAYAWSFPIGGGRANIGYGRTLGATPVTRAELMQGWARLYPDHAVDADSVRAHRLPLSTARPAIADGRVLLVGDAQSLINPLTGEGIYYGLISGALAGRVAHLGADAGSAYRRGLSAQLGRYLRHVGLVTRLTRWPSLMDVVLRRAAVDQRTFDDLVRLGLDDGVITRRLIQPLLNPLSLAGRA